MSLTTKERYQAIVDGKDFHERLESAIKADKCLVCNSPGVSTGGVCKKCFSEITKEVI